MALLPERAGTFTKDERPILLILSFWRDFIVSYRSRLGWIGCLLVLSVILQIPVPLLTMRIIDSAVEAKHLHSIHQLALLLAVLIGIRHIFAYLSELMTLRLKEEIIFRVESRLLRHLQSLPIEFFAQRHSNYLQSRLMNDSRALEGAMVRTILTTLMDGITFLVGAVVILFIRFELGLALLVSLLPFVCLRYYANARMRKLSQEMQERQARASIVIGESFAGIRTLKALCQEVFQERIAVRHLRGVRDIYIETNWYGIISGLGTSLITSLCFAFVLWYGTQQALSGRMTVGEVVGVLSLMTLLYGPVNSLVAANFNIQQSIASLRRIYEFFAERPESNEGKNILSFRGAIEFRDVSFSYVPGCKVLRHINLSLFPGETLAIVGRSGAGKSTLISLLLRFYEVDSGNILLDGQEIRQMACQNLRSAISLVEQHAFLFTGTIADNIRLGKPDASLDEIVAAARSANIDTFIESLPERYETPVGERGIRLSGGQSQRIALARVFLRDPAVIILDEAVSSVDSESEECIQEALKLLSAGRTTIIIAHRLSSLLLADRIVLLEEGEVVEDGTHASLLAVEGAYTKLFRQQFQPQFAGAGSLAEAVV